MYPRSTRCIPVACIQAFIDSNKPTAPFSVQIRNERDQVYAVVGLYNNTPAPRVINATKRTAIHAPIESALGTVTAAATPV